MSSAQALHDLMSREQDGLLRLCRLLEAEHAAITARDTAALEKLTADKLSLLAELDAMTKARQGLLEQAGLTADRAGFESLLGGLADGRELLAQWQTLQENLRACQEQNRLNGMVLDASYRATQQALAVLLGHAQEGETYDAQGTVRSTSATRGFVKA